MILVGDVGGTRTRLALAAQADGGWRITGVEERSRPRPTSRRRSRDSCAAPGPRARPRRSAAPAPVSADGSIRLTNVGRPARTRGARARPPASRASCSSTISARSPKRFRTCRANRSLPAAAAQPVAGEPVAVLGPGTGLGTAIGAPGPGGWIAIPGEGGHADLAPVDDEELEIWQRLRRAHGRVSAEPCCAGRGSSGCMPRSPVESRSARPRSTRPPGAASPRRVRTHALFTRWLGRVAGNLALIAGARGGVYLAGGILPRWGARFDVAAFRRAFEDKAPYAEWLRAIPSVHRDASAAGPARPRRSSRTRGVSAGARHDRRAGDAARPRRHRHRARFRAGDARDRDRRCSGACRQPRHATVVGVRGLGRPDDRRRARALLSGAGFLHRRGRARAARPRRAGRHGPARRARASSSARASRGPGEFTERAFHNGKLDLVQAEAIADLISAGSAEAARAALRSLVGRVLARGRRRSRRA